MKKIYHLIFFLFSISVISQTACDDANYYIISSYSHVKDSYESNNVDHVKYYANRAVKSLRSYMDKKDACDCVKAQSLAQKSYDMLAKVDYQETYEDARFFVKRTRDSIKASVIEDDKCSSARAENKVYVADEVTTETTLDTDNLSELQQEQLKLKAQQEALKRKELEIKVKLVAQKEKEEILEKGQLISKYENVLKSNIETYNKTLKVCGSDQGKFTYPKNTEGLENKSISEINNHYKREIKAVTTEFLNALNTSN